MQAFQEDRALSKEGKWSTHKEENWVQENVFSNEKTNSIVMRWCTDGKGPVMRANVFRGQGAAAGKEQGRRPPQLDCQEHKRSAGAAVASEESQVSVTASR